jgi:hypothetical protein
MGRYVYGLAVLAEPSLYETLRSLDFSLNLIAELFEHHLVKLPGGGVTKVLIRLVTDQARDGQSGELLDVLEIERYLDRDSFAALDDAEQRDLLGELIRSTLVTVATGRGWPVEPIEAAHRACCAAGYHWRGQWGKPATRRDRRRRAWLEFDVQADVIPVTLKVADLPDGSVIQLPLCRLPGTIYALQDLGALSWTLEGLVRIAHRNGRDWWLIEPDQRDIAFCSPRAERDAHGAFDHGMLYNAGVFVPRNVEQALYWLQRAADQNFKRAYRPLAALQAEVAGREQTNPG